MVTNVFQNFYVRSGNCQVVNEEHFEQLQNLQIDCLTSTSGIIYCYFQKNYTFKLS